MNARRREDDTEVRAVENLRERVAVAENDISHIEKAAGELRERITTSFDALDKAVRNMPTKDDVRTIATQEAHKAVAKHAEKCAQPTGGRFDRLKMPGVAAGSSGLTFILLQIVDWIAARVSGS